MKSLIVGSKIKLVDLMEWVSMYPRIAFRLEFPARNGTAQKTYPIIVEELQRVPELDIQTSKRQFLSAKVGGKIVTYLPHQTVIYWGHFSSRIDLGYLGYRIKYTDGTIDPIIYGSSEGAKKCIYPEKNIEEIFLEDTRPTIGQVLEELKRCESGTWSEYLEYCPVSSIGLDEKWPHNFRWVAVYMVPGGSEGHYLHVDLIYDSRFEHERVHLFTGKTLTDGDTSWEENGRSAIRISQMLNP